MMKGALLEHDRSFFSNETFYPCPFSKFPLVHRRFLFSAAPQNRNLDCGSLLRRVLLRSHWQLNAKLKAGRTISSAPVLFASRFLQHKTADLRLERIK